jgi:hypothetical protein
MIKMTILTKDQMPFTSNKVSHQSKTPLNFWLTPINPLIQPFFLMEKTSSKGKV